jgi:hypothetical protein
MITKEKFAKFALALESSPAFHQPFLGVAR